jgi:ATP-dependent helicase/nuclease subunit A
MSAMSEPMLPFEDDTPTVRLKADTTTDEAPTVRPKPDTTYVATAQGIADVRSVRLPTSAPIVVPGAPAGRQPDRDLPDAAARKNAVDPSHNVVLEASAGTGKTRVLVERYVNLLRAGVEPDHILAITFTRKAAAEMRQRILERLKEASRLSQFDAARWRDLKERLGDIAVSTIDAFCLSLLREFPLEADVDPGFDLADATEVPRLVAESLDQALRICRGLARDDDDVALVFAQLGERRLRSGVAALLDRRLVAPDALRRFLQKGPRDLTAATACEAAAARLRDVFGGVRDGLDAFLNDGPVRHPQFAMLADDLRRLVVGGPERAALHQEGAPPASPDVARPSQGREAQAAFRALIDRLRAYFLTQEGRPRGDKFAGTGFAADHCDSPDAWKRHRAEAARIAPLVAREIRDFRRDLNAVMSRGVWRIFAVAIERYQHTLEAHALLDFSGVLERSVKLLKDMDEFAESRLRLEARHRHVLVDEFQDTSRAQWELVRQLVKSWGEGFGVASDAIPPSIFIVGDRKQSIYGFRDADVGMVDEAAGFIEALRPDGLPPQAITVSFRSVPEILAFVNDVFAAIVDGEAPSASPRRDAFRYGETDRFPVEADATVRLKPDTTYEIDADHRDRPVNFIVGDTVQAAAERVAGEVVHLLSSAVVRDRTTGLRREARAADVAVLFRSRDSHREFEASLDGRGVPTYVYKGLGFFDADEVQDGVAILRYLADPLSDLRAATVLRSRIVRLSDAAVARLGSKTAEAILSVDPLPAVATLGDEDGRVLDLLRRAVPRWLSWVDRLAPSELLDAVLRETAYAFELRGSRRRQARENLKKLRGMIRRAQNRGYATLARIADHLERLAVGDESNAAIDAIDAVSLMTVHAAKGLEFPIVFVVNMGRGTGGPRAPIRVADDAGKDASVAIADYQSEADEDLQARDREESKRLLYVALTRARDRLYLSTTVKEGACRMGRGSLGEVLPSSIREMFIAAAAAAIERPWQQFARRATAGGQVDDFGPLS